MNFMILNKFTLLFLLIFGSLSSTSFAGRRSKLSNNLIDDGNSTQGTQRKPLNEEEVITIIHKRLLRDNTRDYGRYDPSPVLSKPPFKLIPN